MAMIAVCASMWLAAAPAAPAETVVTLYNQLEGAGMVRVQNGWEVGGRRSSSLVDEKNGFLAWFDSGTGGGFLAVEAALFVAKDGRKRLVVIDSTTAVSGWNQKVFVYELAAGKLQRVVEPWFPEVEPELARRPGCNEKSLARFKAFLPQLELLWQLPRKGTTALATLSVDKALAEIWHVDGVTLESGKKLQQAARAAIAGCYAPAVDVEFDPDAFAFRIAKQNEHPFDSAEGTNEDGVFSPRVRPDQMVH